MKVVSTRRLPRLTPIGLVAAECVDRIARPSVICPYDSRFANATNLMLSCTICTKVTQLSERA
jgi:hypothetical protein